MERVKQTKKVLAQQSKSSLHLLLHYACPLVDVEMEAGDALFFHYNLLYCRDTKLKTTVTGDAGPASLHTIIVPLQLMIQSFAITAPSTQNGIIKCAL